MSNNNIPISVGPLLFEFRSESHWVNKAASWFGGTGLRENEYVCIDAWGRICTRGAEFMRAEKQGTYPIKVYAIEQEPTND